MTTRYDLNIGAPPALSIFGGKLTTAFTAHPKIDPATGLLHFFGYGFTAPFLTYHVADATGQLVHSEVVDIPRSTMIHDFAITERDVVFWDLPVIFDVLDRPPAFRKQYDAVDVDAVFYRVVKYETRGDPERKIPGRTVKVPWIVARTVVKCQPDEETGRGMTLGLAVGALVAFLALALFIVYLVRRGSRQRTVPGTAPVPGMSPAGFRRMFDTKLREERRPGPPPPPESGA